MLYLQLQKSSLEKLIVTVVEMLQNARNWKDWFQKKENSCLNWTLQTGRRKVCLILQTDTYKLNIVM